MEIEHYSTQPTNRLGNTKYRKKTVLKGHLWEGPRQVFSEARESRSMTSLKKNCVLAVAGWVKQEVAEGQFSWKYAQED